MNVAAEHIEDLCENLNGLGQQLQLMLEMSRRDVRKNLVIILYSYVLNHYQKILSSSANGRLGAARTGLPEMIDGAFATAAVIHSREAARAFYDEDDVQRIFRRKSYQPLPRDIRSRIGTITGIKLAADAGLTDYYAELEGLLADPSLDGDRTPMLISACESMFMASRQVADFFGIRNLDKLFYEYWEDFSALLAKH